MSLHYSLNKYITVEYTEQILTHRTYLVELHLVRSITNSSWKKVETHHCQVRLAIRALPPPSFNIYNLKLRGML